MSSAKRVALRLSFSPGIQNPCRLLFWIRFASGSIARLKRRQERGSSCLTPLETWKGSLIVPFRITTVSADSYRECTVHIKLSRRLYFLSVRQR